MRVFWLFLFLSSCATTIADAQIDDSKIRLSSTSNGVDETSKYAQLLQENYARGEYELSKTYSDSLLFVSELYGIGDMSVMAINGQAIYYKNKGNKEEAISLYHKALKRCDTIPNSKGPRAMILANMGNIYTDIGAYQKSIATMDTLLVITDTIRSFSKIKAAALVGQATNYTKLNQYEKGVAYCMRAMELAQVLKDESVMGPVLNNLSDIYIAKGEYNKALETIQKGLLLYDTKQLTKNRGNLLLNRGIAQYHLSKWEDAIKSLKAALTLAQKKELPLIELYCYEYLAKVYEINKDFKKSFLAQKEYSRIKSAIQGDEKNAAISDVEQDIESSKVSLASTKEELISARKTQKKWLLYGGIFGIVLLAILLFLAYKKSVAERENLDLREKYKSLKEAILNTDQATRSLQNTAQDNEGPYENSSLNENDRQLHKQRILQMMRLEKPFLNPDLRLAEMAAKLDLSNAHLSEILHYGFKENFHNFINFYRVVEAQELMKQANQKESKIIAIAFESGFKSKTTFNRVFKNYTGQTPSEYRKAL